MKNRISALNDDVQSSVWYPVAVSMIENTIEDDCVIESITSESDGYQMNVHVNLRPVIKYIDVVISVNV